ncbi:flagellar assembly peptidoglycan hydrolase FlgJ [Alteromonas lipolytica]|uniref:Peptidoglycan hydrolase FlgJ n=1 Tax=Alteromonas lipolytica TaxID=1856405 RepID=A0A1E8FF62_9ALTE|nr:flagellar assembly peptidoglycan hydrolase FlgJ [Alteromonas lipolytica]OFI34564.1 flagellar rod assembly protein/muramidase FlgJ [Alteromonas lipolytica]GGF52125.1 flagellar rod assembly protein/muramidase FlgJ [Alteromonas lipolytica]
MDILNTKSQLESARNVHDLSSLNRLREAAYSKDDKALKEAAQQFEAIFVQMMLKSMRQAQDALADKESPFNSEQVKFYRDMHDKQLAQDLSSGGGVGLAEIIVQQLGQHDIEDYIPASVARNDGNLASLNRQRQLRTEQAQQTAEVLSSAEHRQAFKAAAFESPQAFVEQLWPAASKAAAQLGIEPQALLAQAAVETGWGQHVIHQGNGESGNNLFGIKANASWQGGSAAVSTMEFDGTVARQQRAAFRTYDSLEQGFADYVQFIMQQDRYQSAVQQADDPKAYFKALQDAGYATDPNYADKVMAVYHSDSFRSYLP